MTDQNGRVTSFGLNYWGVFGVADYEFVHKIPKFKIAGQIWRTKT